MHPETDTSDREIVLSRTFSAPRELVFAAWTDPRHVGAWWGPRGFTTTTRAMDVRPGGLWTYVMHGPDGVDYENWIRYIDIERPSRLHYDHGGGAADAPAHFRVTVTFVENAGRTEVTMRSVFPTAAARAAVVQRYGAIEGGKQHLARLGEHLAAMSAEAVAAVRRYQRRFAAPRELVFRAWTDPQHLARWWGPHDFTNPVCRFEARPGGAIRIDMRAPDGTVYPMTGEVREIAPPRRLVFACSALDAQGKADLEVLNCVDFAEQDGHTVVTVEARVLSVSAAGAQHLQGMDAGWAQSLERLEELIVDPDAFAHPECDIVTMRLVAAPRELVFAAWTDPAQLQRWWGPAGFTNTFAVFDLRPGGDWRFTMHGPDGTDYRNHSVFVEIRPPELLVFDHLGPMHAFRVRASFYDLAGGTLVRFRMRFADAAECARVRVFAAPANEQNFDRLEAVLAGRA